MTGVGEQVVVAEFYGGPLDGEVETLPDLRHAWLVPRAPSMAPEWVDPGETVPPVAPPPCLVYTLAHDPLTGRASINDAGRYRYEFGGYR